MKINFLASRFLTIPFCVNMYAYSTIPFTWIFQSFMSAVLAGAVVLAVRGSVVDATNSWPSNLNYFELPEFRHQASLMQRNNAPKFYLPRCWSLSRENLLDRTPSLRLDIASIMFSAERKRSLFFPFNEMYLVDSALSPVGSITATLKNRYLALCVFSTV